MVKAIPVKEGLFFPEDFKELKGKVCLFVKEGKLIQIE
jgi:hypothetical protein